MTKICGYISAQASPAELRSAAGLMAATMKHQPATHETYVDLACGTLALLAPQGCEPAWPAWSAERSSCLALCGRLVGGDGADCASEIGAPELLAAYRERGQALLGALNGVFAFAHYDAASGRLSVVNDRYGFMPLYYYHDGQRLLFASEAKAILRALGRPQLDWAAVADFFYVGHMLGERTLFKGIHALPAGCVLTYQDGALQLQQYHDFSATPPLAPAQVSTRRLAELFRQAVARRVRPGAPNTLLLSGGFDSRLILGALHESGACLRAISLEHADGPSQGADARYARAAARALGVPCDERRAAPGYLASGASLASFYILDGMVPTWSVLVGALYPELGSGLGAVWDGLALDVALGGAHAGAPGGAQNLPELLKGRALNRALLRLILRPHVFAALDHGFAQRLERELASVPPSENQYALFLLKNRTRRRIAVNPHQLYAAAAEPVTPAADRDLMDYLLGIPSSMRRGHALYAELLRQEFPALAGTPILSGGALFDLGAQAKPPKPRPAGPLQRLARRLTRLGQPSQPASQRSSAPLVQRVLEQKNFDRPIYNQRLLRRLFRAYRNGRQIYHQLFEIVCYIELWHLLFIDEDSPLRFKPSALAATCALDLAIGPVQPGES